jgi:hypothetical protein
MAFRPRLEALEDRTLLSTYLVTNTGDNNGVNPAVGAGTGTLRQAIVDANAANTGTAADPDLIQFNIPTTDPGYHAPAASIGITSVSLSANVATLTTSGTVPFSVGQTVTVAGLSNSFLDGDYQVTAVTATSFSYALAHADLASTADAGTASDPSWFTIAPSSALPAITDPIIINGYSQPGTSVNKLTTGDNAKLAIVLNGANVPGTDYVASAGLVMNASNSTVEGLAINGFGGSQIYATGNNDTFQGNFIGTDVSGTTTPFTPNLAQNSASDHAGIQITGSANLIGTNGDGVNDPAERNVIAGENYGVILRSTSNSVVAGNFIGTDASGTHALPNWVGIGTLLSANGDRIGTNGTDADLAEEGNLISGNAVGISFGVGGGSKPAETNGLVAGNSIGLDVNGNPLGNTRSGIFAGFSSSTITIGGNQANLANTIANTQSGPGIWIVNLAGSPTGIRIQGNSIHDNGELGIALGGSYPTPPTTPLTNDSVGHVGPNNFQNFPVLTLASSSSTSTSITGSFSEATEQNATLTLDFYANPTGSSSTYGQGQIYLGSRTVVTDASGNASFNAAFALGNLANDWVSATATDSNGNTSEFSQDIQVASAPGQTFTQSLSAALPQSSTGSNTMVIQANPNTINDVVSGLSPSNLGSTVVPVSVYLNLASGTYQQQTVQVPQGMTLYINGVPGTTIDPDSPAFTVTSGNVVVSNVTFVTTGDAPTILVTGGSLRLRHDTIQESTGYSDAAISVQGGTLDLGTTQHPGGNILNVNGTGQFLDVTNSSQVPAVGNTFEVNGAVVTPGPYVVTTTAGSGAGSLSDAIMQINADVSHVLYTSPSDPTRDEIDFDIPGLSSSTPGTITLGGSELLLTNSVIIAGPGAGLLAISGNEQSRVLEVAAGVNDTISGLTIENGLAPWSSGGVVNKGNLTLSNCTLSGNSCSNEFSAGAIFNSGSMMVSGCTLSGNSSGTLFNTGSMTVTDCTFSSNSGGSTLVNGVAPTVSSCTMTVTNCTIADNSVVTLSAFRPKRLCGNLLGRSHHHGEHHGRS